MLARPAVFSFTLLIVVADSAAAAPTFTSKPKASKQGGHTVISFAVNEETDVAVFIEDAQGKVVRHLVAGMLGDNPPARLQKGLHQRVVWDGLNDARRPATGGPFTARVGLGLKPTYAGMIGEDPMGAGRSVRGLAVDTSGNLYMFVVYGGTHSADNAVACHVLSRQGKYLRTILPPPAELTEEQWGGLRRIRLDDGTTVPFFCQVEVGAIVPGADTVGMQGPIITSQDRIGWAGTMELGRSHGLGRGIVTRIMSTNTDGSMSRPQLFGTVLADPGLGGFMTLSPDEKTIYATGMELGVWLGNPTHAVVRCGWNDEGRAQVFIGDEKTPGSGPTGLNMPKDVATDKDGNIYVTDYGNDRVAVFRPDKKLLGEIPVQQPCRIEVARKTGAVYVSTGLQGTSIVKFNSWRDKSPAATIELPVDKAKGSGIAIALDEGASKPILWVGHARGHVGSVYTLLRVTDTGSQLAKSEDLFGRADRGTAVYTVKDIGLDRTMDKLWLANDGGWQRYFMVCENASASNMLKSVNSVTGLLQGTGNVGLDGKYYGLANNPTGTVMRFDGDGKILPYPEGQGNLGVVKGIATSTWRTRARGVTADPSGNVYVLMQTDPTGKPSIQGANEQNDLMVFDPEGNVIHKALIDTDFRLVSSPRLDYDGNIYLMVGAREGMASLPEEFKGQVPADKNDPESVRNLNGYPLIYGSIIKWGPDGGKIHHRPEGTLMNYGYGNKVWVEGHKFIHGGVAPAPSFRTAGTPDICLCNTARFEVDGFGRCFFPDVGRFRVGVIDTNGNHIASIGSYGNIDSARDFHPQSGISAKNIGLRWISSIAAGPNCAYLADHLNLRVIRVKLGYTAEEKTQL